MDENVDHKTITSVRNFVSSRLLKCLHARHKDDCIQYMLMRLHEKEMMGYYHFDKKKILIDYLRLNGIGTRGKKTAATLEMAMALDYYKGEIKER